MRIINIDADELIAMQCFNCEFLILDVINSIRPKLDPADFASHCVMEMNSPIRLLRSPQYENIATLVHTIPIYLRNDTAKKDGNSDKFGAYFLEYDRYNHFISPYIELYIETIHETADKQKYCYNGNTFNWLLTYTLLHELAHAAMDFHNYFDSFSYEVHCKCEYGDKLMQTKEESMAEGIALKIIYDYEGRKKDDPFYSYALNICKDSPWEYEMGKNLVDCIDASYFSQYVGLKLGNLADTYGYEEWKRFIECHKNNLSQDNSINLDNFLKALEKTSKDCIRWDVPGITLIKNGKSK